MISQLPKKQVSIFLSLDDWKTLRYEAARLRIPMTQLCLRWIKPDLDRLGSQQKTPVPMDDDA